VKKAFLFQGSSWSGRDSLAQEYLDWVNNLLKEYPDAEFEFHQSIAPFLLERNETEWVHIYTLVIVKQG